jgi:hypothetical protein
VHQFYNSLQKMPLIFIIKPFIMNFRWLNNISWKKNSTLWGRLTNFFKLLPPERVLHSKSLRIWILRPQISLETYICQQHIKKNCSWKHSDVCHSSANFVSRISNKKLKRRKKGAYRRFRPGINLINYGYFSDISRNHF